jgi:type II secretory pathway pseudopilin PulG
MNIHPQSPKHEILAQRGAMLIETLVAITIFALAMVTIAMLLFPFMAGNTSGANRSQLDRLQIESLARALQDDASRYSPAFAYVGELRRNGSWVTPGEVFYTNGKSVYDLQHSQDFTNAASGTWSLVANTADNQSHTLIFLGDKGWIESVYRLNLKEVINDSQTNLAYTVERFGRQALDVSTNTTYVNTHRVYFEALNFNLANPDQNPPFFRSYGDGLATGQPPEGVLQILLPNPFSNRTINPLTLKSVYKTVTPLRFDLTTRGF